MSVRDKDVDETGDPDADTVAKAPATDDDVPLIDAETALELAEAPPPPVGRGELVFSIILALCGIAIVVVGELTIGYGSAVGDVLGPRAFPRMVGTALTLDRGCRGGHVDPQPPQGQPAVQFRCHRRRAGNSRVRDHRVHRHRHDVPIRRDVQLRSATCWQPRCISS